MFDYLGMVLKEVDAQLGGKLSDVALLFIGTLIPWLYQFGKRLWLSWRFRLSGEYLTIYDHTEPKDGEGPIYARSKIRQRGRKLDITTIESNGRTWKQNAVIVRDQYVSGWYTSEDPFDTGVGTFFLTIKERKLVGHWYGHSHTTQNLRSGNYEFIKMRESVRIEELHDDQMAAALEISDKAFGSNYLTAKDFELPTSTVFAAVKNRHLVGFCLVRMLPANELSKLLPKAFFETSALRHCNENGKIGVIKTIAIDDDLRNEAIGAQLFTSSEQYLFKAGAKAILVPVWQSGQNRRFESVAKIAGYEKIFEDPDYWKVDCDAGNFKCKSRTGTGGCVCRCVFFMKTDRRGRGLYRKSLDLFAPR